MEWGRKGEEEGRKKWGWGMEGEGGGGSNSKRRVRTQSKRIPIAGPVHGAD